MRIEWKRTLVAMDETEDGETRMRERVCLDWRGRGSGGVKVSV